MTIQPFSSPLHDAISSEYNVRSTPSTLRRMSCEILLRTRLSAQNTSEIEPLGISPRDEALLDRVSQARQQQPARRRLTVSPRGSLAKAGRRFTLRRSR